MRVLVARWCLWRSERHRLRVLILLRPCVPLRQAVEAPRALVPRHVAPTVGVAMLRNVARGSAFERWHGMRECVVIVLLPLLFFFVLHVSQGCHGPDALLRPGEASAGRGGAFVHRRVGWEGRGRRLWVREVGAPHHVEISVEGRGVGRTVRGWGGL